MDNIPEPDTILSGQIMKSLLECYRTMLTIRLFEEEVENLFSKGRVQGTTHSSAGQEAVAVGVCRVMRKSDYITSTHRGHGHFIARGGDPRRMMAELFGKKTGYSGGRGGSQFMADFRMGYLGANGITGGSIPIAAGAALSLKLRKRDGVVVCFFGDGASNEGSFHESLNMASLWHLPVLFVCENNMFAMSTHVSESMAVKHVADRATGYGMPSAVADGNNVEAVTVATTTALQYVRKNGPFLLECKTYRLSGHSRGDPQVYKCPKEAATWQARDPIEQCRCLLQKRGLLSRAEDSKIRRAVKGTIRDSVRFAESSPFPEPGSLTEGLFA